ncbi:MAG: hypothetical protein HKP10_06955 [Kiritimatiellales bacterium]|nr:hypothetical protein [Pontiella sp.]NNJ71012.1 hypothetical protein [Kiritimatiellales bacterium]
MKIYIIAVLTVLAPLMAQAEPFGFYAITDNAPYNASAGENQLFMLVDEGGTLGQVSVLFTNTGPTASTLKSIYFDTLDPYVSPAIDLQIESIVNGTGVNFTEDKKVKNFNGGNPIRAFSSNLSLGNDGSNANGIDPNEYLILNLTYNQSAYDFMDMLQSGDLQVGLHAGAFPNGGSEKFVNSTEPYDSVIPEPSTALLLGFSGLLVKGFRSLRQRFDP